MARRRFEPSEQELREWREVEALVLTYQYYLKAEYLDGDEICKSTMAELLKRFNPLFKKYITLIKQNQIDFNDMEQKGFVALFMEDKNLRRVLGRKVTPVNYKHDIYSKANFIKETYGTNPEEDILYDLYICFINVVRRYKQIGKNFCAYLHSVFKYEVARFIKGYIKNPLSVPYKNFQYEDYINGIEDDASFIEEPIDSHYESITGLPDMSWILGDTCSFMFTYLTPIQRKILSKYYLEDWSDRQIAESIGVQTSSINGKRREALNLLCEFFDVDPNSLKRIRKGNVKNKTIK